MFINNTPKVIANSVTAEFVIGKSFLSVVCNVTTQQQKDCEFGLSLVNGYNELTAPLTNAGSEGSVIFDGLNPDRGLAYLISIRGTLSDGTVVTLSREFHVGKQQ